MTYEEHKKAAGYRGVKYTLTREEYTDLIAMSCNYCGGMAPNGIDRVNPKRGFVSNNSVPACARCAARKRCLEHLGVREAVKRTRALADRNKIPVPSKREWRAGFHSTWTRRPQKHTEMDDWEQQTLERYARRA